MTCPSCGQLNLDDAAFCSDCGTRLTESCGNCGASLPTGARFCPACGTPAADQPRGTEERKLVTVLFADVTGSTGLAERLDPEELHQVMATYFDAMRDEIEAEGGTVEKFIGDAVMAAFGVPHAHEDDPARALRAALRMMRRLEAVNGELESRHGIALEMRVGVNTGEALAITEPRPGEPMVTGDVVNAAARLQTAAEPGRTLVAERTVRAVRGFRFDVAADLQLRGKSSPVRALVLVGEDPTAPQRGVAGLVAPMVGRDAELSLLRSLYQRTVAESRSNLVTVYGDAGVGKSRLTEEFLDWAQAVDDEMTVVRGRCLPYGDGVTYWPLAEILKYLAGIQDSDPSSTALERIRALGADLLTSEVTTDPGRTSASLAYTVGVEDPDHPFRDLDPREVRLKTHTAWRALFTALSRRSPVVAVVEDIHWADSALLDILEELAERVVGSVFFLCPARPELTERRPGWGGGRRNVSSIALNPLSVEEADSLVGFLLSVADLPESVRQRILTHAEGNPFFLEEIVRHLIDEGRIVRSDGMWRATGDIEEVEIPDTVQAALAARIDLLDPVEKRVLQRAAVVGRIFWPGPVRRLLDGEADQVRSVFDRLEQRELVLSRLGSSLAGEPEFMFKHVLTREVAYDSLPRRERGWAHAAVAAWIEERAGTRAGELIELLVYHYLEAYRSAREDARIDQLDLEKLRTKALETTLSAAREARRRFAIDKATKLAEEAAALAKSPVESARAVSELGRAAQADYRGDLGWQSLRRAADLLLEHTPEDRRGIARACARAVEVPTRWPGSMKDPVAEEEVTYYIDVGMAHLDPNDESEEMVRLLTARAFGPFSADIGRRVQPGESEEARDAGRRAAEMAITLGRPDLASAALDGMSASGMSFGLYGPYLEILERRIRLADSLESPWEIGDIFAMGAWGYGYVGEYDRAADLAEEGIRRSGVDEAPGVWLHCSNWLAFSVFWQGDWDGVMELAASGRRRLGDRADDPPYFLSHLFGAEAFVLDARGEPGAQRQLDLVRRLSAQEGSMGSHVFSHWQSWILARRGGYEEASDLIQEALDKPTEIYRPFLDIVRASVMLEARRFDGAAAFLEASRAYAAEAGITALPSHLDRLEGAVALGDGDLNTALPLLDGAREGFKGLGTPWELARTDLLRAEVLVASDRADEARSVIDRSMELFEKMGSFPELKWGRSVPAAD